MAKKTPEEIAALKAKYVNDNAAKQKAKEDKKAKFAAVNAQQNMPTVEMIIPWQTAEGREIDLEKPPWADYPDALEHQYRVGVWLNSGKWPEYQVKHKIIRT